MSEEETVQHAGQYEQEGKVKSKVGVWSGHKWEGIEWE